MYYISIESLVKLMPLNRYYYSHCLFILIFLLNYLTRNWLNISLEHICFQEIFLEFDLKSLFESTNSNLVLLNM